MLYESAIGLFERIIPPPSASVAVAERQSGVIPFAIVKQTPVFLLVTSRQRGHWIFPKGKIAKGADPRESALREAYEEAGVEGTLSQESIGSYRTWKTRGVRRVAIEVDMYPLKVHHQHENWFETGERYRHWATAAEAVRLITNKQLIALVRLMARKVREGGSP